MAELILLILGVFLSFWNGLIGIILTVIAFILSLTKVKTQNVLSKIVLVLSIIVLCYDAVAIVLATKAVKNTYDEAKKNSYLMYEERVSLKAKEYVLSKELLKEIELKNGDVYVVTIRDMNMNALDCDGYAIYQKTLDSAKAYLKCDSGYVTEGFDEKYLK